MAQDVDDAAREQSLAEVLAAMTGREPGTIERRASDEMPVPDLSDLEPSTEE